MLISQNIHSYEKYYLGFQKNCCQHYTINMALEFPLIFLIIRVARKFIAFVFISALFTFAQGINANFEMFLSNLQ